QLFLGLLVLLTQQLDFVQSLASRLRNVVDVRREQRGGFAQGGKIPPRGRDGTQSGNEYDPPSVANCLDFAQQNTGNLPGLRDMRSPARREIEVANVDQPQLIPLGGWKFAQTKLPCLVPAHKADVDSTILENDFVGQPLGSFDLLLGQRRRVQIDRAIIVGHVERNRRQVVQPQESSGEHVLAGVLLHMVAAAGGVNLAVDAASRL